jgi:hypothetical protein
MSEHDPNETLREFREYFARSYQPQYRIAARIGISHRTQTDVLADTVKPKATTITRLRVFLSLPGAMD